MNESLITCEDHKELINKPIEFLAQCHCKIHGRYGSYHKDLKISCKKCAYVRAAC